MKTLTIIASVAAAAIASVGTAMALTNPDQSAYEEYAVQRLTDYLKTSGCGKAQNAFEQFLEGKCATVVEANRPQIEQLITQTTQRQNFILFSIYRTNLSTQQYIPFLNLSYQVETVGIFQNFHTYSAQKQ